MKCGEHWRRALNSSKFLHGVTDLRKLSHMEETIFYVTSELSWHWTDTGFSGVRLLEVTVQRLSFMIFLPYCWLMFFQVSAAPLCPFVYTHTGFFSSSNQESPLVFALVGLILSLSAPMQVLPISSVVNYGVVPGSWVLEDSKQLIWVMWSKLV